MTFTSCRHSILYHIFALLFLFCAINKAQAVTLTSDQTDYVTTEDITTSASGIISSLSGDSSSFNTITNLHTITTGDDGSTSSAYGIKVSGDYNNVTNDSSGVILTTGSSGRGISISDYSIVTNNGSITTEGTTAYGIYGGGDENTITNTGSITTSNSTAYGIYINGDNNSLSNSGSINTQVYGIYSRGENNYVTNSGTISTTSGSSAYGIYLYGGSGSAASADNYSTIENSGTISSSTAHGIYVRDDYVNVTNSGTITSGDGSSDYGIRSNGDYATITNSGDITSTNNAIYNGGSGTIINNSGNLYGGVYIGDGTLNILGGTISDTIDGDSTGSVVVSGDFTQSATFEDLTSLTIDSGATLITNNSITTNLTSIDLDSTLTINNGSSISSAIYGVSDGVGTLNINYSGFESDYAIGANGYSLANLNITSGSSLLVNSNIYASNLLVSGDLYFYGSDNLTIYGNVVGNGTSTINVSSNSQIIDGNLTLNSGDNLAVAISGSTIGNITTSGSANIDSNTNLNITTSSDQDYIDDGTQFTIIDAASGSNINSISDSNISVDDSGSNISGFLEFSTSATDNSLILTVNRLAASQVTSNVNAQNIYQNLNDIGSNAIGTLSEFQTYLDNSGLSGDELTQTLNQLAPQPSKANLAVSANIANNTLQIFENRLNNYDLTLKQGAWIKTIITSANQDAIQDDDGYNSNSIGLVIGSDYQINEDNLLGASISYVRSNVKTIDNSKKTLISSNQISFYHSKFFNNYFVKTLGGFAWNSYSTRRSIDAIESESTARYYGQTYIGKIITGYNKNFTNGLTFTPELSLNFIHNKINGYSEKGADEISLDVSKVASNSFETRAGFNLGFNKRVSELNNEFPEIDKISANFNFSYGHSFINDTPNTKANFYEQDSSFTSQISYIDNQSIQIGISFDIYTQEETIISSNYKLEHKPTWQSHQLVINVKQLF